MIINSHSTFGHKTITTRPDDTTGLKIQSQYDKNPQNTQKQDAAHVLSVTWLSPFYYIYL